MFAAEKHIGMCKVQEIGSLLSVAVWLRPVRRPTSAKDVGKVDALLAELRIAGLPN
jgi:hypothetical protein